MVNVDEVDVSGRYRDSYRVAHSVVAAGNAIKAAAIVFAIILVAIAIAAGLSLAHQSTALAATVVVIGVSAASFVAFNGWALGVLVNSSGQLQLAALDAAVYACPFMTNPVRAEVMGLRRPTGIAASASSSGPPQSGELQLMPNGQAKCWKCGKVNAVDQDNCWSCYTKLRRIRGAQS